MFSKPSICLYFIVHTDIFKFDFETGSYNLCESFLMISIAIRTWEKWPVLPLNAQQQAGEFTATIFICFWYDMARNWTQSPEIPETDTPLLSYGGWFLLSKTHYDTTIKDYPHLHKRLTTHQGIKPMNSWLKPCALSNKLTLQVMRLWHTSGRGRWGHCTTNILTHPIN